MAGDAAAEIWAYLRDQGGQSGTTGVPPVRTSTFETASRSYLTQVYLETPGGLPIHEDIKYGVGTIVAARFDEPIANKAEAERRLTVTANPPIRGSWYWVDDQTAHWRPEKYYAPGTTVTVAANILEQSSETVFTGRGTPGPGSPSVMRMSPWPTTPPNR